MYYIYIIKFLHSLFLNNFLHTENLDLHPLVFIYLFHYPEITLEFLILCCTSIVYIYIDNQGMINF